jgi:hypothetical protein
VASTTVVGVASSGVASTPKIGSTETLPPDDPLNVTVKAPELPKRV